MKKTIKQLSKSTLVNLQKEAKSLLPLKTIGGAKRGSWNPWTGVCAGLEQTDCGGPIKN